MFTERDFFGWPIRLRIFSLPYSLLLDYSMLSSLPYPTLPEIEKPLPFRAWRKVILHAAGLFRDCINNNADCWIFSFIHFLYSNIDLLVSDFLVMVAGLVEALEASSSLEYWFRSGVNIQGATPHCTFFSIRTLFSSSYATFETKHKVSFIRLPSWQAEWCL